jgi:GAF domain-containing protein
MSVDVCRAETEADALIAAGRHIHDLFGVEWAGVGLRSADGTRVRLVAIPADGDPLEAGRDLPAEGLALSEAASTGATLADTHLADTPFRDLAGLASAGMASAVVAPLHSGPQAIGALLLARRSSEGFGDDDRLLVRQVAAFLTSVLTNLRTLDSFHRAEVERDKAAHLLARRASEFDLLGGLFADPGLESNEIEPCSVLDQVVQGFVSLRGIELCRVTATDEFGTIREIATAAEVGARFGDAGSVTLDSSPEGSAIAANRTVLWRNPDPDDTDAVSLLQSLGVTSLFSVPIVRSGEPIGVLTAASVGRNRLVTAEHITMAEIVGRSLPAAIDANAELMRERRSRALEPASELLARLSS